MIDPYIREDIKDWIEKGSAVEKFKQSLDDPVNGVNGEEAFNYTYNMAYLPTDTAKIKQSLEILKKRQKAVSLDDRQLLGDYNALINILFLQVSSTDLEEIKLYIKKLKKDTGYGTGGRRETGNRKEEEEQRRQEEERRRRRQEKQRQEEENRRRQEEEQRRRQEEQQRQWSNTNSGNSNGGGRKKRRGRGCLIAILAFIIIPYVGRMLYYAVSVDTKKERVERCFNNNELFQGQDFDAQRRFIDSAIDHSSRKEQKAWKKKRETVEKNYTNDLINRRIGQLFEKNKKGKSDVSEMARKKYKDDLREVEALLQEAERRDAYNIELQQYRMEFDSLLNKYKIRLE